jgi:hypothetical protein
MATAVSGGMREQIERWFARQGLPLFIRDYGARRSMQRTAVVLSGFWFIEALILAPNHSYSLTFNVLAIVVSLVMLFGIEYLVTNLTRGLSPTIMVACSAATIVLVPPLIPVLFGRQLRDAALTATINLGLITFLWLLVGGIVPVVIWSFREARRQVFHLLGVLARTLPVFFVGITLLFLTAEIWQIAANLHGLLLLAVSGLFVAIGRLCLIKQLVREVGCCCEETSELTWSPLVKRVEGINSKSASFFKELAALHIQTQPPKRTAPTTLQRINIGVVLLFAESLQILVVSAVLAGFFIIFGLLAISSSTAKGYLGGVAPHPMPGLPNFTLWGQPIVLMQELAKVTVIIALFSYLSFVFYAVMRSNISRSS